MLEIPVRVTNVEDVKDKEFEITNAKIPLENIWLIEPIDYLFQDVSKIPENHYKPELYYHFMATLYLYLEMAGFVSIKKTYTEIANKYKNIEEKMLNILL